MEKSFEFTFIDYKKRANLMHVDVYYKMVVMTNLSYELHIEHAFNDNSLHSLLKNDINFNIWNKDVKILEYFPSKGLYEYSFKFDSKIIVTSKTILRPNINIMYKLISQEYNKDTFRILYG